MRTTRRQADAETARLRHTFSKAKEEMEMAYMIIGIHGLSNKPAADVLEKGWRDAILEGLTKNERMENPSINFTSVYWADVMYDAVDPEPDLYKPAKEGDLKTYDDTWIDSIREGVFDWGGDILDGLKKYFGFDHVADAVLKHKLKDLSRYYEEPATRQELRSRLEQAISKHTDKRLMILSHSMGTIIAYDVLRAMGKTHPRRVIDHFVTLGSPLGLPHVKAKIARENPLVRTPSIVQKWSNFADKRDPVSFDITLAGDYKPNVRGIKVTDDLVANDWGGIHHKSYGYLRTPEVSRVIRDFV